MTGPARRARRLAPALAGALALLAAAPAGGRSEEVVSGEIVILSDDIRNTTTEVIHNETRPEPEPEGPSEAERERALERLAEERRALGDELDAIEGERETLARRAEQLGRVRDRVEQYLGIYERALERARSERRRRQYRWAVGVLEEGLRSYERRLDEVASERSDLRERAERVRGEIERVEERRAELRRRAARPAPPGAA